MDFSFFISDLSFFSRKANYLIKLFNFASF
jgi:hypothetical protein